MKTLHSILTTAVAITALAGTAGAQSLGTIYPKSQGIATTGSRSGFGTGSLWENSLGDSWNYPTWKYAYGTIKAGYGDSQAFVSVTNRNFIAAVTTPEQLGNWLKKEIDKWAQVVKAANLKLE